MEECSSKFIDHLLPSILAVALSWRGSVTNLVRLAEHLDVLFVWTSAEAWVFCLDVLLAQRNVLDNLLCLLERHLYRSLLGLRVVLGHTGFALLKPSIFHINLNPLPFSATPHLVNRNYHRLGDTGSYHRVEIAAWKNLIPRKFHLAGVEFCGALKLRFRVGLLCLVIVEHLILGPNVV